ncbi:MAG: TRAP transporter small permease [Bosea sp. (in: a-proteobacteria)]
MIRTLATSADRLVAVVSCGLVIALLGVVTTGIISRAFGTPQVWTDEAAGYLMAWLSMFGWMVATRRAAHIRIRYFNDKLPDMTRRVLETCFLLIAAGVGITIIVQGMHLVSASSDVAAITLPVSTAWLYLPLIPAGLVTFAQAISELVAVWRPQTLTAAEGTPS